MSSKQLELLRHAKSSWADPGVGDHDRPLNDRGRGAAALVGRLLRRGSLPPDLVLCSSATRAQQTLQLLELAPSTEVVVEDQLYGADAGDLLARLRATPAAVRTLLLIGHNPGIEQLARILDRRGLASVVKFPTAGLAVLGFAIGDWRDLQPGAGHLANFFTPRELS
jgi:phosphohistidine phosphatase